MEKAGREICGGCLRPASVCYCACLPNPPLSFSADFSEVVKGLVVYVHPLEVKRKMGSLPLLTRSVTPVHVFCRRKPGSIKLQRSARPPHFLRDREAPPQKKSVRGQELPSRPSSLASSSSSSSSSVSSCHLSSASSSSSCPFPSLDSQASSASWVYDEDVSVLEGGCCTKPFLPRPLSSPVPHSSSSLPLPASPPSEGESNNLLLLFPTPWSFELGAGALPLKLPVTLLCLDGTWKEAKEMLRAAPWLEDIPAVRLPAPPPENDERRGKEDRSGNEERKERKEGEGRDGQINSRTEPSKHQEERGEATDIWGAYGFVRTPSRKVADEGGVCTAEAVARSLALIARWSRAHSSERAKNFDKVLLNLLAFVARRQIQCKEAKDAGDKAQKEERRE
ncbi:DTW domain protein [Toxoplasma gondii TgCatPRC2]|uniref:tRNA-uridine aminocarboxypropyltransferase n=7 Tax=Toxoplasma gondii TaxID=5811 RepID=S7UUM2_TOXGG|nr:hypothetical protein TGME49_280530 [Toxoplasma gondii ME49]EPR61297.1 hypothetical protein TGGT1_280530 [Toxoplasma gondii GT1]KAF4642561.1 hypothetical protein TGRH88_032860 [Toxoplasma gondii]KFG36309.1 DTW domain protein [Toxoplasma gondii FOU]KYF44594.1 DTW domain protein [Toxoplasma gondii ARI]KYK64033.1 DTW domain protein [Toxoplasma gondii TgCatPRC2]PIM02243.1 DTW domain protein [Toxoplasma gondii COUG]|eukprot:XP_002371447.1 hypothetical protein TGME49_280530 [Toxoplasma gondii ME49]